MSKNIVFNSSLQIPDLIESINETSAPIEESDSESGPQIPLGNSSLSAGNESISVPEPSSETVVIDPNLITDSNEVSENLDINPCDPSDFPCLMSNNTTLDNPNDNSIPSQPPIYNVAAHTVTNIPENLKFLTGETSVAASNNIVFFTGNKYAARSFDGGNTWESVDIRADMYTCCDQDVIFDNRRGIFIWYRQGNVDPVTKENIVSIAISKDTIKWNVYNIKPTTLNSSWREHRFDYPYLALGDKYLYASTDKINDERTASGASITRNVAVIMRISLDDLASANPASLSYYASKNKYTYTMVHGATDTMYWATHLSNEKMRVYKWKESDPWNNIMKFDISIKPWNVLKIRDAKCGREVHEMGIREGNWCGQADSRIGTGWIIQNRIGFFWNADSGSNTLRGFTFPMPYIDGAVFDIQNNNVKYLWRPYIWNYKYPILYPSVSPDKNNNLGLLFYYGNGVDVNPTLAFGIKSFQEIQHNVPWNTIILNASTHSPKVHIDPEASSPDEKFSYEWGDYVRVRPMYNSDNGWIAAGFILNGGSEKKHVTPYYYLIKK